MKIIYPPRFKSQFSKLSDSVQGKAKERIKIFKEDPFDDRLETHKLKGKLKGLWSFSIDQKHRIIFEFSKDKESAYFHTTGDHSIYE